MRVTKYCRLSCSILGSGKGRCQDSLPLTTTFSQKFTKPSKGINYPASDICRCFTKLTGPSAYTLYTVVIQYPKQMVQMTFFLTCNQVTMAGNQCFPACFCHPTVGNCDVFPNPVILAKVALLWQQMWVNTPHRLNGRIPFCLFVGNVMGPEF